MSCRRSCAAGEPAGEDPGGEGGLGAGGDSRGRAGGAGGARDAGGARAAGRLGEGRRPHERLGGMLRSYHRAAWPSDESSDTTRTTLMVAHRLTTIRQVDKVLVVDQGRLTEAGAPRNLLAEQGYYARVVNGQLAL